MPRIGDGRLSPRDRAIFKSPLFLQSLREALRALEDPYVPTWAKDILFDGIKVLRQISKSETVNTSLNDILSKLQFSGSYLKKKERKQLLLQLLPLIDVLDTESTAEDPELRALQRQVESLQLTPSESDCFFSLVFNKVSDSLADVLEASGVHTLRIWQGKQKLEIEGELEPLEFRKKFEEEWSRRGSKWKAHEVLNIISYTRTPPPSIVEDSGPLCQGLRLDDIEWEIPTGHKIKGTIGGFLHVKSKDGDGVFALTAAHCVTPPTEDIPYILNAEADLALLPVPPDHERHETVFCSTINEDHDFFDGWQKTFGKFPTPEAFPSGTPVFKIGAKTGVTMGILRAHRSDIKFKSMGANSKNLISTWNTMIEVGDMPGQVFSRNGDSGSLYFVQQGSAFIPIAVHRGSDFIKGLHYATRLDKNLTQLLKSSNKKMEEYRICQNRFCPVNLWPGEEISKMTESTPDHFVDYYLAIA